MFDESLKLFGDLDAELHGGVHVKTSRDQGLIQLLRLCEYVRIKLRERLVDGIKVVILSLGEMEQSPCAAGHLDFPMSLFVDHIEVEIRVIGAISIHHLEIIAVSR